MSLNSNSAQRRPPRPQANPPSLPLPVDACMGFDVQKYPNPEAYVGHLRKLEANSTGRFQFYSDRCCWTGDHKLYWLVVGDASKPVMFLTSVLHARNEWQGAHVVMRFAERLLDQDDVQQAFNTAFLESYCLVAIPMVNPWGYFADPDGMHHNNHRYTVPNIESADWHDMDVYSTFSGVNLNRNFDCNWEEHVDLPWRAQEYWNGNDYGRANYFMMPYREDENGRVFHDPSRDPSDRVLRPDPGIYDGKGATPFSEPETQLIRDLFIRYQPIGYIDFHLMNPWQKNNTDYISRNVDRARMIEIVDAGIARVNRRHAHTGETMPPTHHIVLEEYEDDAPYAINWAQNRMGVPSYDWETGTGLPEQMWTDAYQEILYRAFHWLSGFHSNPSRH